MKISFDHQYQHRHMTIRFEEPTTFRSEAEILAFREQWMSALKNWHSPYKALIDGSNLSFQINSADRENFHKAFERTLKLLSGFFLKKAAIFGVQPENQELIPFESYPSEDEARQALGLDRSTLKKEAQSFRDTIQLQNHFRQHVMELSFSHDVIINQQEQINELKSKLTNNLMQWHSAWSLLVDCSHLQIEHDQFQNFERMIRFFHGFFLKAVIGYSPQERGLKYPFDVVLARHKAAAQLEAEGNFSGEDANCQSRRTT